MRENQRFRFADYIDLAIFADDLRIKSNEYIKPHPMGWLILKNILSTAGGGVAIESSYILIEFKNLIMKKALDPKLIQRIREIAPRISEENAVYIGDSISDFEFAENAGIKFIAITSGRTTEEEFKNIGASFIATSHLQLIDIISNLGVKIIIFDFDGTLINHFPARYKAYCDYLMLINKRFKGKIKLRKLDYDSFTEVLKIRGFGKLPQAAMAACLIAEGFIELNRLKEISNQYYSSGKTKLMKEVLNSANQNMEKNLEKIKVLKEIFKANSQLQINDNLEHPSYYSIYQDVPLLLKKLHPTHLICLYSSKTEKASEVLLNSYLKIQI